MASKLLLSVHLEVALAVVNHYFVVHRLPGEVLSIRVHSCVRDRLHIRLTDVLGDYRNAELPEVHLLVICS